MKDIKQVIDKLWQALINFDWFCDIKPSNQLHNALVVYVDSMSVEIYSIVPDTFEGYDIRVHYIQSIEDKHSGKEPKMPVKLAPEVSTIYN